MGFLPLIGLFANVIFTAVSSLTGLSPNTSKLITSLISGITPLVSSLTTGSTKLQDVLAVLAGLSSIIATLKLDTALPVDKLNALNLLDGEVQAAISGYIQAGKGYDAGNYSPITPVQ